MDENRPEAEAEAFVEIEQSNLPSETEAPVQEAPAKAPGSDSGPKAGSGKKKRNYSKKLKRILAAILTVLLVVLAVLVFVFRNALTAENLRQTFGKASSVAPARDAFTYETGAEQLFASAGNGLAVASGSSVQLLDAKGQTVFKQVVSFESPTVFASGDRALFCDLSGTGCIVADTDGESRVLTGERKILTAHMNSASWFTLVTAEPGYKGLVSVYNSDCEKQYEWWSGTGYVLQATVSPDNRYLAVLTVEKEGSVVRFFALNSETEQARIDFPDQLLYDLRYMDNSNLCAVGEPGLFFLTREGKRTGEYPLDGQYLLDYTVGTDLVAAFYSSYRSGAGGSLVTLDRNGTVLGTAALERDVLSMSVNGKQLLVMTGGGLTLYDDALVRQYSNETLMTARQAILRPEGDILLCSAYAAERFRF